MKSSSKTYAWIVVALLWVVALLNYLDRQILSTLKNSMQVDIADLQSANNFGRLMAIFLWIYGFMSPFSGMIADKFNRKWLIIISLFIWSGVTFFMGFTGSINQLMILRGIMGMSEAIYIPAGLSLIADYHSDATRSLAIGLHMTGLYMGQALGGFGAIMAVNYSWQNTFHFFGIIGILYSIVLLFFLHEKRGNIQIREIHGNIYQNTQLNIKKVLSLLLSRVSFWVMLFYFSISSLPGWGIKNWLPTLFATNLNIDMTLAGPIATITIAISSLIGVVVGGILSDKWIRYNNKSRIYISAIGLSCTIPALLFLGLGHSMFSAVLSVFCFGLGFGMFDANNMPIICQIVPVQFRASAYGLMNMMGVFAGALVTNWLGKSTDEGNLGTNFALLSIAVAFSIILLLLFVKPNKTQDTVLN